MANNSALLYSNGSYYRMSLSLDKCTLHETESSTGVFEDDMFTLFIVFFLTMLAGAGACTVGALALQLFPLFVYAFLAYTVHRMQVRARYVTHWSESTEPEAVYRQNVLWIKRMFVIIIATAGPLVLLLCKLFIPIITDKNKA